MRSTRERRGETRRGKRQKRLEIGDVYRRGIVTGKMRRGKRVGREKETDERDIQMREGSATIRKGRAVRKSRSQVGRGESKYVNTVLLKKEKSGNPR
jgi:hypothetical protein